MLQPTFPTSIPVRSSEGTHMVRVRLSRHGHVRIAALVIRGIGTFEVAFMRELRSAR